MYQPKAFGAENRGVAPSVFDIFKVGIGPSSSHTMGPMVAARAFVARLEETAERMPSKARIRVTLRGSLAFTGKGHGADHALQWGLLGFAPDTIDLADARARLAVLCDEKRLTVPGFADFHFDPAVDIDFDYGAMRPGHPNQMTFEVRDEHDFAVVTEHFYSIGGGAVLREGQAELFEATSAAMSPYEYHSANELVAMAGAAGISIAEIMRANECVVRTRSELSSGLEKIWREMNASIDRGLSCGGELPGGLKLHRRAFHLHKQLESERRRNQPHAGTPNEWLSAYAMAVNEENAAGGRIVTAPTNGAAGVVPAVMRYYLNHDQDANSAHIEEFLLTAAAIGGLIKLNASISGAELGCQGEVGTASAMAAAGLCAVWGGTPPQIENAAEIALEHHLGMTCDPVAGLVQVPCIERNAFGAIKAYTAACLALRGDGMHFMPLDNCISAMRQTGEDMNVKYRETALGGLAANVPNC